MIKKLVLLALFTIVMALSLYIAGCTEKQREGVDAAVAKTQETVSAMTPVVTVASTAYPPLVVVNGVLAVLGAAAAVWQSGRKKDVELVASEIIKGVQAAKVALPQVKATINAALESKAGQATKDYVAIVKTKL